MLQKILINPDPSLLVKLAEAIGEGADSPTEFEWALFPAKVLFVEKKVPGTDLIYLEVQTSRQIPGELCSSSEFHEFLGNPDNRQALLAAIPEGRLPEGIKSRPVSELLRGTCLSNGFLVDEVDCYGRLPTPQRTSAAYNNGPLSIVYSVSLGNVRGPEYLVSAERVLPQAKRTAISLSSNEGRLSATVSGKESAECTVSIRNGEAGYGADFVRLFGEHNCGARLSIAETAAELSRLPELAKKGIYRNPLDCSVFG
ncbi:MAG: hypothetical protein V1820_04230 [archaeon]